MSDTTRGTAAEPEWDSSDKIGGPFTTELAGTTLTYRYTTGDRYRVTFADRELVLEPLHAGHNPPFTIAYRARRLRDGLFLVGWATPAMALHVSLVVDVANGRVHVSALMPGGAELFDLAEVETSA